jgi:hypothetical protein
MKDRLLVYSAIVVLLLGCALAGCGGGSSDDEAEVTAQAGSQTGLPEVSLDPPPPDPEKIAQMQELIRKMKSSDEREAYDAILKLSMLADETASNDLYEVARYHRSENMRSVALRTLARLGDQRAVQMVLDDLRDRDANTRRNAAAALGGFKNNKEVIEPLIEALRDDDGWVRMNAQGSLEKITRQDIQTYDKWREWYWAQNSSR